MESITSLPVLGSFRSPELCVLRRETAAVAERILTRPLVRGHVEAAGARPRAAPASALFRSESLFGLLKRHSPVLSPPPPTPMFTLGRRALSGRHLRGADHWVPVHVWESALRHPASSLGSSLVELAPHTSKHLHQEWPRVYQE